jgi:fibro-slime domain-containing protein
MLVLGAATGCGSDDDGGTAGGTGGVVGKGGSGAGGGSGGLNLGGSGAGGAAGGGGSAASGGGGTCGLKLTGTVRDFSKSHPDFESFTGNGEKGIVQATLGGDGKPVYVDGAHQFTTTKANFDHWYRDVPGTNQTFPFSFSLTQNGNVYTYDNGQFFPIDGKGFGDEGLANNFHFTFELHTEFVYKGGEVFTFIGDDDLWTFINGKLAIDLGGVHPSQTGSVDLDAKATELGLQQGKTYALDVFQAERHTSESHFRIDTSLEFTSCGEPPK